jgi:hypothetical protein
VFENILCCLILNKVWGGVGISMGVDGLCVLTLFAACPTREIVIKCNIANKLLFFHRNMKRSLPSPTKPSNTNSPTKRPVLSVENVHPIHLIRLHPMWPTALRKCKRDYYKCIKCPS